MSYKRRGSASRNAAQGLETSRKSYETVDSGWEKVFWSQTVVLRLLLWPLQCFWQLAMDLRPQVEPAPQGRVRV